MIANYDALTHHLDVDYINDRVQFEKTTALITAIVNNNYPNFTELPELIEKAEQLISLLNETYID